jgi:hypothetical protein
MSNTSDIFYPPKINLTFEITIELKFNSNSLQI